MCTAYFGSRGCRLRRSGYTHPCALRQPAPDPLQRLPPARRHGTCTSKPGRRACRGRAHVCGWGIHPGKWGSKRSPCKTSRLPPCCQLGIFVRLPAAFLACFLTCRARRQEAPLDVVELHEHGTRHARTAQQHLHTVQTRTMFRQQHTPKGPAPPPTPRCAACDTPDRRRL